MDAEVSSQEVSIPSMRVFNSMINKPVKLSFKFITRQTLKVFRISFWLFVITTVVFLITLNLGFVKSFLSVKVIDYLSEQTGY